MAIRKLGGHPDRIAQEAKLKENNINLLKIKAVAGKTHCYTMFCNDAPWKECIKSAKHFYDDFPLPTQPKSKEEARLLAYQNFKNLKLFLAVIGNVQTGASIILKQLDDEITGLKETQMQKAEAQNSKLKEDMQRQQVLFEEKVKDLISKSECFSWQNILALAVKGVKDKILANKNFKNDQRGIIEKEFSNIDKRFGEINTSYFNDDGKTSRKKL